MKKLIAIIAGVMVVAFSLVYIYTSSQPVLSISVTKSDLDQIEGNSWAITRDIEINKGGTFEVHVYSFPSAGWRWSARYDGSGIIKQQGDHEFISDKQPEPDTNGSPPVMKIGHSKQLKKERQLSR